MYLNLMAMRKSSVALLLTLVATSACKNDTNAAEPAPVASTPVQMNTSDVSIDEFSSRLEKARPGLKVTDVEQTAVPNIVRVNLEGAGSIYALKGTDFFFVGELYQAAEEGLVNVTEQEKVGIRKELLAKASVDNMIVFSPEGEAKDHITIFTDVDCGYCQKLHREVPELNAMGIEVRYMAFPRAGIGSPSYQKIASAWCAEDPRAALTKVKNRETIDINVCDGNPVAAQYELGQQMGVNATPIIMFDSGESIPGYMPAKQIAARLEK